MLEKTPSLNAIKFNSSQRKLINTPSYASMRQQRSLAFANHQKDFTITVDYENDNTQ